MKHLQRTLILCGGPAVLLYTAGCAQTPSDMPSRIKAEAALGNVIVASKPGMFYGWPANNRVWTWGGSQEILVGFSQSKFDERSGHNPFGQAELAEGIDSLLARSRDGGLTWAFSNRVRETGGSQVTGRDKCLQESNENNA